LHEKLVKKTEAVTEDEFWESRFLSLEEEKIKSVNSSIVFPSSSSSSSSAEQKKKNNSDNAGITDNKSKNNTVEINNNNNERKNRKRGRGRRALPTSSLISAEPTSIDQKKQKMIIKVTPDVVYQVFSEFPAVKRAYEENVPEKLTEKEFWTAFYKSRYFYRGGGEEEGEGRRRGAEANKR